MRTDAFVHRSRRFLAMLLAISLGTLAACGGDDGDTLTVTVTIPSDAEPLPDGAVLTVRIEDTSLADTAATTVSETSIDVNDGSFPIDVELPFDAADLNDRAEYTVAARVEVDGSLRMISDTVIPVITRGNPRDNVTVALVET